MNHCYAYDVLDHIDATCDTPIATPADPFWKKLDELAKIWLYTIVSWGILNMIIQTKYTAR